MSYNHVDYERFNSITNDLYMYNHDNADGAKSTAVIQLIKNQSLMRESEAHIQCR